jgi:hypothetical protein
MARKALEDRVCDGPGHEVDGGGGFDCRMPSVSLDLSIRPDA